MGYWSILIFCSVVLAVLITITWYSVKKQNDRSELGCEMGVIVAISFAVFALVRRHQILTKYCISYTALTKNVLNIEKVDK